MNALMPAALMLIFTTAPTLAEDGIRKDGAFIERETAKSLNQISGCLNRAWEQRDGQISYVPDEKGFVMRLSYTAVYAAVTAVQVEVEDKQSGRLVKVYARKGDRREKLQQEIAGCV